MPESPTSTGSQGDVAPEPLPEVFRNLRSIAKLIRQSHGFTSSDALGSFQHSWLAAAMVNLARSVLITNAKSFVGTGELQTTDLADALLGSTPPRVFWKPCLIHVSTCNLFTRIMVKLGPLLTELEENLLQGSDAQKQASGQLANSHLPAIKRAVARVRDVLRELKDVSALRASLRAGGLGFRQPTAPRFQSRCY